MNGAVTIQVGPGAYSEQVLIDPPSATGLTSLTIQGAVSGGTSTLTLPTSPQTLPGSLVYGMAVESATLPVTISDMVIDGGRNTVSGGQLAGVVFDDASGTVNSTMVQNWTPASGRGSGIGIGILVQSDASGTSDVTVQGSQVTSFGKDGIAAAGPGSTLTAEGNTVTSASTSAVATNGIEVKYGATGTLIGNTVAGNDFTAVPSSDTDPQSDYAAGILLYGASGTTSVAGNQLSDNQIGIEDVASNAEIGGAVASDANQISEDGAGIPDSIGIYAVPCDQYCGSETGVAAGGSYTIGITGNSITGIPQTYGQETNPAIFSAGIWIGNAATQGAEGSLSATVDGNTLEGGFLGIQIGPYVQGSVSSNTVSAFERTGIQAGGFTVGGDHTMATIAGNTVTGAGTGNTDPWAQNGIEMANGATGTISDNQIAGLIYTGKGLSTESSGITIFESSNVITSGNTISDSQTGIAVQSAGFSGTYGLPGSDSNWAVTGDTVTGNTISYDSNYTAPGSLQGETVGTVGIWPASYCSACSVTADIYGNVLEGPAGSSSGAAGIIAGDGGSAGNDMVSIDGNSITGWTTGIDALGTNGGSFDLTVTTNDLSGDTTGVANDTGTSAGTTAVPLDAKATADNWWGSTSGPTPNQTTGDVTVSTWIQALTVSPSSTGVIVGGSDVFTTKATDQSGPVSDPNLSVSFNPSSGCTSSSLAPVSLATGSARFTCAPQDPGKLTVTGTLEVAGHATGLSTTSSTVIVTAPAPPPSGGGGTSGGSGGSSGIDGNQDGSVNSTGQNTTITVDPNLLDASLGGQTGQTVTFTSDTPSCDLELPAGILETLIQGNDSITVQTPGGTLTISASAIDLNTLERDLGVTNASDIALSITVTPASPSESSDITSNIPGVSIVGPVEDFTVTASVGANMSLRPAASTSGTKTVDVFAAPVPHTFTLSAPPDTSNTTGIILVNGMPEHAWTVFNGSTAVIESRTNGTFAVIQHTAPAFSDTAGLPEADAIQILANKLVIQEGSRTVFNPDAKVTKAQFVAQVIRALGLWNLGTTAKFSDVPETYWAVPEISSAVATGLIHGLSDGTFRPNQAITNTQMAGILGQALAFLGIGMGGSNVTPSDEAAIPAWARGDVSLVLSNGIMNTGGGLFHPTATVTRAETAQIVWNLMQKVGTD